MYSRISSRSVVRNVTCAARAAAPTTTRLTRFSSTMHDNDPETLETEKIRNLAGTQYKTSTPHKHAPGWNEHLASASEASVKADKDTTTASATELQKTTVEYIQSRHSPDEDISLRDQVDGPLSSAASESDGSHQPQVVVRETVREKTEVLKDGAIPDRGVLSTE